MAQKSLKNILAYISPASENILLGGYISRPVTFPGLSVNPKCNHLRFIQFQTFFFDNLSFHGSKELKKRFGLH